MSILLLPGEEVGGNGFEIIDQSKKLHDDFQMVEQLNKSGMILTARLNGIRLQLKFYNFIYIVFLKTQRKR